MPIAALLLALAPCAQRSEIPAAPAPAAETFAVEVRLRTQYGFERGDERPVPHVRVELGVVADEDAVDAERYAFVGLPVLASATSDDAGELRARLELPPEWRTRSGWIWARAEHPGHTRRTIRMHERVSADETARLVLHRGGTLLGRATTADGAPVAGAHVSLVPDAADGGRGLAGTTARDGRFAVAYSRAGAHTLHVRSAELGSAQLAGLALDPTRASEPVELVVRGGSARAFRLVDPRGEPVPGAWVTATPADASVARSALERDGGLAGGRARSDVDGRLELPALLPGTYSFYARYAEPDYRSLGAHLARLAVAPGAEPIELVFARTRIEVRVTESSGAPACGVTLNARGEVEGARLTLQRVAGGALGDAWLPPIVVGDLVVFDVEPEAEYVLAWQENAVPYAERRIEVPFGAFRVPVELELGARGAPARLAARVVGPDGEPCLAALYVSSSESGRSVRVSLGEDELELPPGRYRVRAELPHRLRECEPPPVPMPRAPYAPGEAEIEVRAGELATTEIRMRAAGHLDFQALSPRTIATVDADGDDSIGEDDDRARLGGGRAVLLRDGERLELREIEIPAEHSPWLDWIVPGWPGRVLDPIPAGDWTLRVEDGERVLLERAIRVDAGRITVVRW